MDEKKFLNELLLTFFTILFMWVNFGLSYMVVYNKDKGFYLLFSIMLLYIYNRTFTKPFLENNIFNK